MNPIEMIKGFIGKGMNPQQILGNVMKNNSNPVFNNLIEKAKEGDTKGVETFARNLFKEQGRDFDKEFAEFRKNFR